MNDSKNPLSPHLQIYRWHISSLLSITHRISGVINLLALILIFFWLLFLSLGESNYELFLSTSKTCLNCSYDLIFDNDLTNSPVV